MNGGWDDLTTMFNHQTRGGYQLSVGFRELYLLWDVGQADEQTTIQVLLSCT